MRPVVLTIVLLVGLASIGVAGEQCPTGTCADADATAKRTMPKGHPPVGDSGADAAAKRAMPKGHPPIGDAGAAASEHPAVPTHGTLAIRALQGTPDSPQVAGDKVTVTLYRRTGPFKTIETQLDEHGVIIIEDLPIDQVMQPQVVVKHKGVRYERLGKFMNASQATQELVVNVYETTRKKPSWKVAMRHVMLTATESGYEVKDSMTVKNPADRTWIGAEGDDTQTLDMLLPSNAADIKPLRGFDDCCTKVVDGKLMNRAPVLAGSSRYELSYTLPANDGQMSVDITTSCQTDALIVFVPDEGAEVSTDHFEDLGTFDIHKRKLRAYKATDLQAGQRVVLAISRDAAVAYPSPIKETTAVPSQTPKVVAGVGVLGMVVVGAVVMLIKPLRAKKVR